MYLRTNVIFKYRPKKTLERKVKPQLPPKFTHFLHFLHERLTIEKRLTRQQQQIKQNDPKLEPTLDPILFR